MKMVAPPRQAPASMRSPGTPRRSTSTMQRWRLSSRYSPIMLSAWAGQSRPSRRVGSSNGTCRMTSIFLPASHLRTGSESTRMKVPLGGMAGGRSSPRTGSGSGTSSAGQGTTRREPLLRLDGCSPGCTSATDPGTTPRASPVRSSSGRAAGGPGRPGSRSRSTGGGSGRAARPARSPGAGRGRRGEEWVIACAASRRD